MKVRSLLGIVPFGVIALGAFVTSAGAQQAAPPITIDSCAPIIRPQPQSTTSPAPSFFGTPITQQSAGMSIEFVNDSNTVATVVNFAVDDNGNQFVIRDVGTFSPGVSIKHNYTSGSGQNYVLPAFITPRVTCRVASVTFADKTTWPPPSPPAAPLPAAEGTGSGGSLRSIPALVTITANVPATVFLVQTAGPPGALAERDSCNGIATISVASTGDRGVTYLARGIGPGACAATISGPGGSATTVQITVRSAGRVATGGLP